MTKAVGYIRVLTQGQVRDGYSLTYQRDEIMRNCAKNGIELVWIYEDKGISGGKVDEDVLTVERDPRWSNKPIPLNRYLSELKELNGGTILMEKVTP